MLTFGGLPTFLGLPNLGARPRVFAGRVSKAKAKSLVPSLIWGLLS